MRRRSRAQDEKAYRLTVVLAGIALGLALQGRVAETGALFEEAKAANPAYRESILVELEATVRWIAGDFAAAVALVHEAVAWQPTATPRRRAIGMTMGALAAIERDDEVEAERLVDAGEGGLRRSRLVVLPADDARGGSGTRVARGSRRRLRGGPAPGGGEALGDAGPAVGRVRAVRPG